MSAAPDFTHSFPALYTHQWAMNGWINPFKNHIILPSSGIMSYYIDTLSTINFTSTILLTSEPQRLGLRKSWMPTPGSRKGTLEGATGRRRLTEGGLWRPGWDNCLSFSAMLPIQLDIKGRSMGNPGNMTWKSYLFNKLAKEFTIWLHYAPLVIEINLYCCQVWITSSWFLRTSNWAVCCIPIFVGSITNHCCIYLLIYIFITCLQMIITRITGWIRNLVEV